MVYKEGTTKIFM
jgi:PIN domain